LCSLRFLAEANNVLVMGPVGVGKTFLANALGHAAVRRRYSVHIERADKLFKRLRAARLDHTHEEEMRKLHRVELLILDLSRPGGYPDCFPSSRRRPCSGRASGG
jgi:DNA replication protein DnaC